VRLRLPVLVRRQRTTAAVQRKMISFGPSPQHEKGFMVELDKKTVFLRKSLVPLVTTRDIGATINGHDC
jgi:hypothetical protein